MFYYLSQLSWTGNLPAQLGQTGFPLCASLGTSRCAARGGAHRPGDELVAGPRVIAWLKQLKFGQEYADKAEAAGGMTARVLSKKGTPTMGGILIVLALNLTTILWAQLNTLVYCRSCRWSC